MTELQALVTGFIAGSLIRANDSPLKVSINIPQDKQGNFLPVIHVTGRVSGERLVVRVQKDRRKMNPTSHSRRTERGTKNTRHQNSVQKAVTKKLRNRKRRQYKETPRI